MGGCRSSVSVWISLGLSSSDLWMTHTCNSFDPTGPCSLKPSEILCVSNIFCAGYSHHFIFIPLRKITWKFPVVWYKCKWLKNYTWNILMGIEIWEKRRWEGGWGSLTYTSKDGQERIIRCVSTRGLHTPVWSRLEKAGVWEDHTSLNGEHRADVPTPSSYSSSFSHHPLSQVTCYIGHHTHVTCLWRTHSLDR